MAEFEVNSYTNTVVTANRSKGIAVDNNFALVSLPIESKTQSPISIDSMRVVDIVYDKKEVPIHYQVFAIFVDKDHRVYIPDCKDPEKPASQTLGAMAIASLTSKDVEGNAPFPIQSNLESFSHAYTQTDHPNFNSVSVVESSLYGIPAGIIPEGKEGFASRILVNSRKDSDRTMTFALKKKKPTNQDKAMFTYLLNQVVSNNACVVIDDSDHSMAMFITPDGEHKTVLKDVKTGMFTRHANFFSMFPAHRFPYIYATIDYDDEDEIVDLTTSKFTVPKKTVTRIENSMRNIDTQKTLKVPIESVIDISRKEMELPEDKDDVRLVCLDAKCPDAKDYPLYIKGAREDDMISIYHTEQEVFSVGDQDISVSSTREFPGCFTKGTINLLFAPIGRSYKMNFIESIDVEVTTCAV